MSFELAPGVVVAGRYRLDRLLGTGGMGQVWAVTHEVTLRPAALKFLNAPVHHRADRRRRFLREARAASAVQHPNVVQIHDFFELEDGTPVMLMDLLEGETLAARLRREGALSLVDAVNALLPVVSAVGTAHALGIVHRDLKPDNVFLCDRANHPVRVLDFGIAKLSVRGAQGDDAEAALTGTGAVLGTPRYMSPEQSFGDARVDHRADIWSIGVILYESLSGVRPIEGENLGRILQRLMNEGITPLRVLVPDLPETVLSLVDRMLTRDVEDRPRDLREVHAILAPHGTVTVPSFESAIEERQLALDSSPSSGTGPSSAPRPSVPPASAPSSATVKDVSVTLPDEPASGLNLEAEVAGAHELVVRQKARKRRWTFAMGLTTMLVLGLAARHYLGSVTPGPAEATSAVDAVPPRAKLPDPVALVPDAVAEAPSAAAPESSSVEPRLKKRRASRPAPVAPTTTPAAREKPRVGLVEEPPF